MKKQNKIFVLLAVCVLLLAGCGKKNEVNAMDMDNESLYGELVAGLEDGEQFALVDVGEPNDVLFTTDQTYDDGNGHNAAICCTAYYSFDGKVCSVDMESMGTAYPVCWGDRCVYTASGHSLSVYRLDKKEKQWTVSTYEEVFSQEGDSVYRLTQNGETKDISEQDYEEVLKEYSGSTVVNFGYGASDNPF